MKIEIERSYRAYDGAILVWHRLAEEAFIADGFGGRVAIPGPWYIVKVIR